jgi:hypothetical protein
MLDQLQQYMEANNAPRRKANRWALGLGIACCCISILAGNAALDATKQGLLIFVIVAVGLGFKYLVFHTKQTGRDQVFYIHRSTRRSVFAGAYAALIVLLGISQEALEAKVLERRLRSLTQKTPLSNQSISQISAVFKRAENAKVEISRPLIGDVKSALKETYRTDQSLAPKAIQAGAGIASYSTYALPAEIQRALADRTDTPTIQHDWAFRAIASGGDLERHIRTGRLSPQRYQILGFSPRPDYALMEYIGDEKLNAAEFGPTFFLAQNLTATLDGYHLKRIVFRNADLSYLGGPMILEHVYFLNCRFTATATNNSWKFIDAFKSEGRVDVQIV